MRGREGKGDSNAQFSRFNRQRFDWNSGIESPPSGRAATDKTRFFFTVLVPSSLHPDFSSKGFKPLKRSPSILSDQPKSE